MDHLTSKSHLIGFTKILLKIKKKKKGLTKNLEENNH